MKRLFYFHSHAEVLSEASLQGKFLADAIRQLNELVHRELLRSLVEYLVAQEKAMDTIMLIDDIEKEISLFREDVTYLRRDIKIGTVTLDDRLENVYLRLCKSLDKLTAIRDEFYIKNSLPFDMRIMAGICLRITIPARKAHTGVIIAPSRVMTAPPNSTAADTTAESVRYLLIHTIMTESAITVRPKGRRINKAVNMIGTIA